MTIEITPKDEKIIDKWIFIILGALDGEGIRGRIRITKELFLISKKISTELDDAIFFYPYQFGPYSSRLASRMNHLIQTNQITLKYEQRDWKYSLSNDYIKKAEKFIGTLTADVIDQVNTLKKRLKKMSTRKILREIYTDYPEYAQVSLVAEDIIHSVTIDLDKESDVDDGPGFVKNSTNTDLQLTEEETQVAMSSMDKGITDG
jgi:uncharacterized protein YwgA